MIHDARIVWTDGRPHAPSALRRWLGDSRGHWEGNTLVVDTTNFTDKNPFRGSGENLHLTERFTRTDANTLLYEFTVDDPTTFTRPWTAQLPMTKSNERLYEYACHEGNYALPDILRGARFQRNRTRKLVFRSGFETPAAPAQSLLLRRALRALRCASKKSITAARFGATTSLWSAAGNFDVLELGAELLQLRDHRARAGDVDGRIGVAVHDDLRHGPDPLERRRRRRCRRTARSPPRCPDTSARSSRCRSRPSSVPSGRCGCRRSCRADARAPAPASRPAR